MFPVIQQSHRMSKRDASPPLYQYALLDTPSEDSFDDLVAMGARYFDVP
jgi:hypothetical protein